MRGGKTLISPKVAKEFLSAFATKDFRPYQEEAIAFAMNSDKKFVVVEMPTGSGKSLVAMVCAVMAGQANYVCSSKPLQAQVAEEFPEVKTIWGRNNYDCLARMGYSCDDCYDSPISPCLQKENSVKKYK